MRLKELKDLIKKSMVEVAPNSGAMTPEEEEMVTALEKEREEMDLTSGPSVVPGAVPIRERSVILNQDEVYAKYAPLVKQYMENGLDKYAAISKAEDVLAREYGATPLNIRSTISDYFDDQYRNSTYANENVLREADEIVAAYTKKKTLKEAAPSSANASKIAKLQKERDQIMHDMEQEAEPEGGPVADEYGAMLDKIDAQIRKLKGLKETASIKEAGASSKYWVVAKDKRGELYVFNDGYYNTKEEANNALKNISVPKIVDANTIKVQPVPTSPNYIGLFKNLSEGLNEEMHGGYLELLEMNPDFEEGVSLVLTAWNEWKEGPMTEPYMVEEAKQDILAYLSSMMN